MESMTHSYHSIVFVKLTDLRIQRREVHSFDALRGSGDIICLSIGIRKCNTLSMTQMLDSYWLFLRFGLINR